MCSQAQYNFYNSFQTVNYTCIYAFNIKSFSQMSSYKIGYQIGGLLLFFFKSLKFN